MSDSEVYAPNQQYVRPDHSGPAEEGEGGTTHETEPAPKDGEETPAKTTAKKKA